MLVPIILSVYTAMATLAHSAAGSVLLLMSAGDRNIVAFL